MAYMKKDGSGPYPNKAGEFCGNHNPDQKTLFHYNEMRFLGKRVKLSEMYRFGRPRSCEAFTLIEGMDRGWVGMYLKEGYKHFRTEGEIEIPTPPELMEPGAINPPV